MASTMAARNREPGEIEMVSSVTAVVLVLIAYSKLALQEYAAKD
jgi:hypothetical protein